MLDLVEENCENNQYLLSTYYVPGTMLSALYVFIHFNLATTITQITVIFETIAERRIRKEVTWLVNGGSKQLTSMLYCHVYYKTYAIITIIISIT